MDIGDRRWQIWIQTTSSTDNNDGTFATSMVEVGPYFASRKPMNQSRILEDGAVGLAGSITWNINKNDFTLVAKISRIRDYSGVYMVQSVTELPNLKDLEITGTLKI